MTYSLALRNIYVEGDDDVAVLSRWFPGLQFEAAGGKEAVQRQVERDPEGYGLLDRDFAMDDDVEASRAPVSRVAIMRRYTIENYLLEPVTIAKAVSQLTPVTDADEFQAWLDEAHIHQMIQQWAEELALYAAANSIISEWRDTIMFDRQLGFLRYFGPLPPLSRVEVVESLQRRVASLTPVDQIGMELDVRYEQVTTDLTGWEGLHRWIHGKVLLKSYLYPRVFEVTGLSQSRLRDLLIEAGRAHIPMELQELAQWWAA